MSEKEMNGQINPAKPYAISAMIILCVSLTLFFIQFARKLAQNRFWKFIIKISGIIAMTFTVLIFTKHHDLMTKISSIFGFFIIVGIIWEVYISNLNIFKIGGIACVILLGINYLPLIQEVTFFSSNLDSWTEL